VWIGCTRNICLGWGIFPRLAPLVARTLMTGAISSNAQ
jgi:hypothetical protein